MTVMHKNNRPSEGQYIKERIFTHSAHNIKIKPKPPTAYIILLLTQRNILEKKFRFPTVSLIYTNLFAT